MNKDITADLLARAGQLMERQRRAGKSIHDDPNLVNIILGARRLAKERAKELNMSPWDLRHFINKQEMEGERNTINVRAEIKVVAVFAYYWDPISDINQPAVAEYFIRESNHPALPEKGNVMAEALAQAGIKVPSTPSYDEWVRKGRKAVRS